jgi:hypothetical protein
MTSMLKGSLSIGCPVSWIWAAQNFIIFEVCTAAEYTDVSLWNEFSAFRTNDGDAGSIRKEGMAPRCWHGSSSEIGSYMSYTMEQNSSWETDSWSWLFTVNQFLLGAKFLETHDQRFFLNWTVAVKSSLTRGWVCRLKFLLGLGIAVILRVRVPNPRPHDWETNCCSASQDISCF